MTFSALLESILVSLIALWRFFICGALSVATTMFLTIAILKWNIVPVLLSGFYLVERPPTK